MGGGGGGDPSKIQITQTNRWMWHISMQPQQTGGHAAHPGGAARIEELKGKTGKSEPSCTVGKSRDGVEFDDGAGDPGENRMRTEMVLVSMQIL